MSKDIQEALLDLRARQETGEHMPCPRCGRDTMKPTLATNALSRHADGVYVCDDCYPRKTVIRGNMVRKL
jgi:predicted RNA-binding Zn-ribbon protein involved in translation (DUF1610 family)